MFEITRDDIARLNDDDLRTLVARLAIAELHAKGCPVSSVAAGGHQDAPDGGLDVLVDCPSSLPAPDFIRRQFTGFQVKKTAMPANEIKREMRPKGVLRPVIAKLAEKNGAYIIVSAKASVTSNKLKDREDTMRAQLRDSPDAAKLKVAFYDRDKLATWVNLYPGIVAWVRTKLGISLSGWSSIGDWHGVTVGAYEPYLLTSTPCIIDERTGTPKQLTLNAGIYKMREVLSLPRQCVRLIGLSGLGKTRLVKALFDGNVGESPLDPGIAVYTDYSESPDPLPRDMARGLVNTQQRAILIVDNCKPATHAELARICSENRSAVSLITIEYDVREDDTELTEVFRLKSAPRDLIEQWLLQRFPDMRWTWSDQQIISKFSEGNFRIAGLLTKTLERGKPISSLKDQDLFERLFQQRNSPDSSLLRAAEDLALFYSINGDNTDSDGELARVSAFRSVSVKTLYEALASLQARELAQQRNCWFAILPQAIANRLACSALKRISPKDFDQCCASLTPRMLTSLARRLGYLHDDVHAQSIIERWLCSDGLLGHLATIDENKWQALFNIAPVDPKAVLKKIKDEMDEKGEKAFFDPTSHMREKWIRLIGQLAYDAVLFADAAYLLAHCLVTGLSADRRDPVESDFGRLFRLRFSETQESPEKRRDFIRKLVHLGDYRFHYCACVALDSMLDTQKCFRINKFDFGARVRGWGWMPQNEDNVGDDDAHNWYINAIKLVNELSPAFPNIRDVFASHVGNLWCIPACRDIIEQVATQLSGQFLWVEGWSTLRELLRCGSYSMPEDVRARLSALVEHLAPKNSIQEAYAFLFTTAGHLDASNKVFNEHGEPLKEKAKNIGSMLAGNQEMRSVFIGKMLASEHPSYAWELGSGIAAAAVDLSMIWQELASRDNFIDWRRHIITLLCGFIHGAQQRDARFTDSLLENCFRNPEVASELPRFQAAAGIDSIGIARLQCAISQGIVSAGDLYGIIYPGVAASFPAALNSLLRDIAELPEGIECALSILNSHFKRDEGDRRLLSTESIELGQWLLCQADLVFVDHLIKWETPSEYGYPTENRIHNIIYICCDVTDGEEILRNICKRARTKLENRELSAIDISYLLNSIFKINPYIALDEFFLPRNNPKGLTIFAKNSGFASPVENMSYRILFNWAITDPKKRFFLLGREMMMFYWDSERESRITSNFRHMLSYAQDKSTFLGDIVSRISPDSVSGARIKLLALRREAIIELGNKFGGEVLRWVEEGLPKLDRWIENEEMKDCKSEQSFE